MTRVFLKSLVSLSESSCCKVILLLTVYLCLCVRVFWLIWHHSVNVLYWDEWDFYTPLFDNYGFWDTFSWQHGPHRQGLGLILTRIIASFTRWDTRADSYAIGLTISFACITALWLKKKLFGKLSFSDVVIPVIFFSTSQVETLVGVPNLSHAALPLLLLMLYCISWLVKSAMLRCMSILVLNFVLIFTGFGLFIAPITFVIFGIAILQAVRSKDLKEATKVSLALIASVASCVLFLIGYVFNPAVPCFVFPIPNYSDYFWFVSLMYAGFCGLGITFLKSHQSLFGIAVLLVLLSVFLFILHTLRLVGVRCCAATKSLIISILLGYSLLFSFIAAVGRICLGLGAAQFSRYMTLLIPSFLGLYFCLTEICNVWTRRLALFSFLVFLLPGYFPLDVKENYIANYYRSIKSNWKQCYSKTQDIETCDQLTGFKICPDATKSKLQQKLDYLKKNQLNLFVDSK